MIYALIFHKSRPSWEFYQLYQIQNTKFFFKVCKRMFEGIVVIEDFIVV